MRLALLLFLACHSMAAVPPSSVMDHQWHHKALDDSPRGIMVSIVPRPLKERKGDNGGSGSGGIEKVGEARFAVYVNESDEQTVTVRVRLSYDTLHYLVTSAEAQECIRFVAISHINEARLPDSQAVELLKLASELPVAALRFYAWPEAFEYRGTTRIDWLHRVLLDPCLSIAHEHAGRIADLYGLRDAAGKPFSLTEHWRGALIQYYECCYRETYAVAVALRQSDRGLISDTDIQALRVRSSPPDDWLSHHFGTGAARMKEYYQKQFP